jgi:hypothetical protein
MINVIKIKIKDKISVKKIKKKLRIVSVCYIFVTEEINYSLAGLRKRLS